MSTLLQSLPYKEWIIGVGLDSDEKNNPLLKFVKVFQRAREEGYLLTMHCDVNQAVEVDGAAGQAACEGYPSGGDLGVGRGCGLCARGAHGESQDEQGKRADLQKFENRVRNVIISFDG